MTEDEQNADNAGVGWCIVAIPQEQDPVWKYSSEKIPHITLLYLGPQDGKIDPDRLAAYVKHVAETSLRPFGMSVERRGELGPNKADVLFFEQSKNNHSGYKQAKQARDYFLADTDVQKAYNSVDQYPEWTPHLTMGYPNQPAKKDDRDYPTYYYVEFDKIALWTSDFTGYEFLLNYPDHDLESQPAMAMTERVEAFLEHRKFSVPERKDLAKKGHAMPDGSYPITSAASLKDAIRTVGLGGSSKNSIRKHIIKRANALKLTNMLPDTWNSDGSLKPVQHGEEFVLAHFGVKGMHWGVRRNRAPVTSTTVTSKNGKIKKVELSDRMHSRRSNPSEDAKRTAVAKAVVKSHSTDALSNEELKALTTRMNLEQQYSNLSAQQVNPGHKFVTGLLGNAAKQQAQQAVNQASAQAVKRAISHS